MNFTKLIMVFSNLPIVVAAVYSFCIYRKLGPVLKTVTWYIFLTVLIQLPYLVLWLYSINNLPLLHLYVFAGFICLCIFYFNVLKGFISPVIITAIAGLFSCYTILNSIFLQHIYSLNSYALTTEAVLVVILSLSTFIVLLNNDAKETQKEIITSLRWINSGLFIYYASSLLLFYFSATMGKVFSLNINRYVWLLSSLFLDLMYICFIVGLWKRPKD